MKTIWTVGIRPVKVRYFALLGVSLAAAIVSATQPVATGYLMDLILDKNNSVIGVALVALCAVVVFDIILQIVATYLQSFVSGVAARNVRDYTLRRYMAGTLDDRDRLVTADAQNRILTDTAMAVVPFAGVLPSSIRALWLVLCCFVGMAFLIPWLFLALAMMLSIVGIAAIFLGKHIHGSALSVRFEASRYATEIWNLFQILPSLKSRKLERWACKHSKSSSGKFAKTEARAEMVSGLMSPLLGLGTQITLIVTIAVVVSKVVAGDVTPGEGAAFVMFFLYAIAPIVELGGLYSSWISSKASLRRVANIWTAPEQHYGNRELELKKEINLHLDNVNYEFPGADRPLFKDLSLHFDEVGVYVLRGSNGIGKSTLLEIAAGIRGGARQVKLNGVPLASLSVDVLRDGILLVDQYRVPFSSTLRDNLGAGLHIDDAQRFDAMRKSGLIHHVDSLDVRLGDQGLSLSGGQRALLALSDAVLRKPRVLLLDEITAGVDRDTVRAVLAFLEEYAMLNLVIVATHDDRLNSIAHKTIDLDSLVS